MIRMRVLLEMLALHRTHMLMLLLLLLKRISRPVQLLQRKQIWMRNRMRVLSLGDLRCRVVGRQVPLELEVCVAWGEMRMLMMLMMLMMWGGMLPRVVVGRGVLHRRRQRAIAPIDITIARAKLTKSSVFNMTAVRWSSDPEIVILSSSSCREILGTALLFDNVLRIYTRNSLVNLA